jgi:hypothetical protein
VQSVGAGADAGTAREDQHAVPLAGRRGCYCAYSAQATAVIEDLITLCGLDPDIGVCAAEGCEFFVSKRRKTEAARTYCGRHRKQT